MSTFVIHPIWPVSKPESMQYGLFRITHQGEQECCAAPAWKI